MKRSAASAKSKQPGESAPAANLGDEVNRCLRALGPLLLRASVAADSDEPAKALPALKDAAHLLFATVARLS